MVLIVDARRRSPARATFHSSAAFAAKANKADRKHACQVKKEAAEKESCSGTSGLRVLLILIKCEYKICRVHLADPCMVVSIYI